MRRMPYRLTTVLRFHCTDNTIGSTQEPSLGDMMVRSSDGAVTVYYTDGIQSPQWLPICTDIAGVSVYTVICRQRGYKKLSKKDMK